MRYKFHALIMMGLLTACSPITDDYNMDESTLSAHQLQLNVNPQQIDGKNGNVITVENNSPILSEWTVGSSTVHKAYAELTVPTIGQHTVNFRGYNAEANTYTEKSFTVQVDTISSIPTDIANRLCIGQEGAPNHYGVSFDPSKITFHNEENVVYVCNSNPVLTEWSCGDATANTNIATLKLNGSGEFPLTATFTLADGRQITRNLGTIIVHNVELPQIIKDLVGEEGQKTWTWESKNFYGFGGYQESQGPDWFAYDAGTMGMYASYFGMSGEETGSMTFNVDGTFSITPTGRTGTFTYDLDDVVPNWSVGKLKINGSILFGMAISMETYQPSYLPTEFYIVKCDADHLVLAALSQENGTAADWAPCTIWCLKPQK